MFTTSMETHTTTVSKTWLCYPIQRTKKLKWKNA